jgi:PKD domain
VIGPKIGAAIIATAVAAAAAALAPAATAAPAAVRARTTAAPASPAVERAGTIAAPASPAVARTTAGVKLFAGVVPDIASGSRPRPIAHLAGLGYRGGPVLHSNRTHLIFWEPSGSGLSFDPGYQSLIERFMTDVAADSHLPTNVYGLSGQYRDSLGPAAYASSYRGAVLDTDPLPPNGCSEPPAPPAGTGPGWQYCLTAQQLEVELTHVLDSDRLPQSLQDIYILVTPDGLGSCEFHGPAECALGGDANDGYCGYHGANDDEVPYAVIPYNAVPGHCQSGNPRPNSSTADPSISTISHEHNESVTDPLGDAWIDGSGDEEADLCVMSFGATLGGVGADAWNQAINGDHYYLQQEWSDAAGSCQSRARGDSISFSAVRRGLRNRRIWFSARVSSRAGPIQSFEWFFGDHRRAHGRRVSHTFRFPGSYRVVLRSTDSWGNWAFYVRRFSTGPRS